MSRPPLTALIVLTAGRSSRMGEPKALLRFGRQTALELAVRNAIRAGVPRVVAVAGHRAEEIRAAHAFYGLAVSFHWAVNLVEGSPMLESLKAALRVIAPWKVDAFFFQPIDLPLVTASDLRLLIDTFAAHRGEAMAFLPSWQERAGHPVLCDARLIGEFLDLPADATPRDVLRRHPAILVETGNPGVLEDMDTRDDYQRLRAIYEASHPDALPPLSREVFGGG